MFGTSVGRRRVLVRGIRRLKSYIIPYLVEPSYYGPKETKPLESPIQE